MTGRQKGKYGMSIRGIPFLSLWYDGNDTGVSFGIKHLDRDIHLTMYSRGEILNFHISDSGKIPRKVWETEMTVDELLHLTKKIIRKINRYYWWGSKYYQFSDNLHKILESHNKNNVLFSELDLDPFIKEICSKEFLQKKRIRDGFNEGFRVGLIPSRSDWYIAIPFTRYRMVKINVDLFKSPLRKFPSIEGMARYIQYLDDEGMFEKSEYFDEEYRDNCKSAIIGLLSEMGLYQGSEFIDE